MTKAGRSWKLEFTYCARILNWYKNRLDSILASVLYSQMSYSIESLHRVIV